MIKITVLCMAYQKKTVKNGTIYNHRWASHYTMHYYSKNLTKPFEYFIPKKHQIIWIFVPKIWKSWVFGFFREMNAKAIMSFVVISLFKTDGNLLLVFNNNERNVESHHENVYALDFLLKMCQMVNELLARVLSFQFTYNCKEGRGKLLLRHTHLDEQKISIMTAFKKPDQVPTK